MPKTMNIIQATIDRRQWTLIFVVIPSHAAVETLPGFSRMAMPEALGQ
jgi:hypothetical protein